MNSKTVHTTEPTEGSYVRLPVPLGDPDVFRYGATADILHLLVDNPDRTFTNRELHRVTGNGLGSVNAAVDALEALGVITVDRSGRANAVQVDPEMLIKGDDPVTTIPQSEYHAPVRTILTELEERIGDDVGIVLFGSVAQGTADRTSDIDLFVVVRGRECRPSARPMPLSRKSLTSSLTATGMRHTSSSNPESRPRTTTDSGKSLLTH